MSFSDYLTEDARLTILKELAAQTDGRLNDTLITRVLEVFGHRRSREWVRTQLLKLEELGAIRTTAVGSVLVAEILRAGTDHVERRSVIAGVARPSAEA
ncbi:hypothetical protein V5F77_27510 [Xanthobacter sp. DSM 24535]|uniref:VpaChn25_0724 family phage protein n=1 Tax=Roseixanthobacter psychrophilus TaxID=3119917 RepID=UPI00372C6118